LVGLAGVVMVGFGGFFVWLSWRVRKGPDWSDLTVRIWLATRAASATLFGACLLVAAILRSGGAVLAAGFVMLMGAAVYRTLAWRMKRAERRDGSSEPT
jgi:hypothetical protein